MKVLRERDKDLERGFPAYSLFELRIYQIVDQEVKENNRNPFVVLEGVS